MRWKNRFLEGEHKNREGGEKAKHGRREESGQGYAAISDAKQIAYK